ncbi:MAG: Xaa-Pro aminopeptidase [uncultured Chthoniobacterales bacterium]|uniref:Xaa-Pro aminopeptidase n=1 Tax=uncultured Chthoniobacterales bacterium TaxID=1836801 RepID=A0A6J4HKK4_9BACT|nr:MAG: Xaa-Pro aminopeptidase [uncultured Chthoniobacterales bacterium]
MSKIKVPKQQTRLIVAASDTDADMLYATRMFVPDPFIFLEQNGKRTVVLSDLEIDRARKQAQADEILPYAEFEREVQGKDKKAPAYEKVLVHFLQKRGVKSALVPANFQLGYAKELERHDIQLQTTNGLFWPEREAKTEDELRLMRRALSITEKGMARAMEVLAACKARRSKKLDWFGRVLTSEILRAEIDSAILRAGGLPANTIVAGGDQACDPHERGSGPLSADSLIILDIFPRDATSGYYGDMTRTVVRGRASEEQRRLWETVKEGQALGLKRMKPGVDGLAIHNEIKQLFTDRGFPTEVRDGRQVGFFHGTGHGLGLEIHEHPRLQKTVLKPGQVLTVEPGLYYPGLGGVRIEDVAAVTDDGIRLLSRFEKRLEI